MPQHWRCGVLPNIYKSTNHNIATNSPLSEGRLIGPCPPRGPIAGCRPLPQGQAPGYYGRGCFSRLSQWGHTRTGFCSHRPGPSWDHGGACSEPAIKAGQMLPQRSCQAPPASIFMGILNCERFLSRKTNTSRGTVRDGKIHRFDSRRGIFDLCRNLCTCSSEQRLTELRTVGSGLHAAAA